MSPSVVGPCVSEWAREYGEEPGSSGAEEKKTEEESEGNEDTLSGLSGGEVSALDGGEEDGWDELGASKSATVGGVGELVSTESCLMVPMLVEIWSSMVLEDKRRAGSTRQVGKGWEVAVLDSDFAGESRYYQVGPRGARSWTDHTINIEYDGHYSSNALGPTYVRPRTAPGHRDAQMALAGVP